MFSFNHHLSWWTDTQFPFPRTVSRPYTPVYNARHNTGMQWTEPSAARLGNPSNLTRNCANSNPFYLQIQWKRVYQERLKLLTLSMAGESFRTFDTYLPICCDVSSIRVKSNALPEQARAVINHRIDSMRYVSNVILGSDTIRISHAVVHPSLSRNATPHSSKKSPTDLI